jgi:hypothetical protein
VQKNIHEIGETPETPETLDTVETLDMVILLNPNVSDIPDTLVTLVPVNRPASNQPDTFVTFDTDTLETVCHLNSTISYSLMLHNPFPEGIQNALIIPSCS